MDKTQDLQHKKNSNFSLILIAVNLILALVLSTTGEQIGDSLTMALLSVSFSATILLGAYAFTYHGKGYRWAKVLFAILFLISMLFVGLLWLASSL